MTTIIAVSIPSEPGPMRADLLGTLIAGWQAMRRHRRARKALVVLSRRPPRLLRDIGIEPERVYEMLDGTSDAVGPPYLSRLLRDYGQAQ